MYALRINVPSVLRALFASPGYRQSWNLLCELHPSLSVKSQIRVPSVFQQRIQKGYYIFVLPQSISKPHQTAQLHYAHGICLSLFHVLSFRLEAIHESSKGIYQNGVIAYTEFFHNFVFYYIFITLLTPIYHPFEAVVAVLENPLRITALFETQPSAGIFQQDNKQGTNPII